MSKAYKCDRCGKLYGPYKKNSNSLHITPNPNCTGGCLDLCPKCNAELQSWVANSTVQEEKQKADDEIKVGDEVANTGGYTAIVTCIRDETCIDIVWNDGSCANFLHKKSFEKTGRHFDIQSIFDQMKKLE